MRKYGLEIRNEQLPISVLVRCPLLAVRCNLPDSKVLRLQLKFTSDNDFKIVYDLLIEMGCRIAHSVPPSKSTTYTNTENAGPPYPASSLASFSSRPGLTSTQGVEINNQKASIPPSFSQGPDIMPSVESTRPQTVQTQLPLQISQLTTYEKCTDRSELYRNVHSAEYPVENSRSINNEQLIYSSRDHQNASSGPSPSHVYRSSTLPSHAIVEADRSVRPSSSSDASGRVSSVHFIQGQQQRYENAGRTPVLPLTLSSSASNSVERMANSTASIARTQYSNLQTITENEAISSQRPWTAPRSQTVDALTQLIPPRRELPFQRSSTAQKTRVAPIENSSRPSSSTADLPALPKPNFVVDVARAARPTITHHQHTNSHNNQQQAGHLNSVGNSNPNSQQVPPPVSNSSRGLDKQNFSTSSDLQSSSTLGFSTSRATVGQSETVYLDRIVAQISAEVASAETGNLTAYAARPADERRTVINDWMMQHIEDDDFLTLCQDVWGCWRRIGLGL